MTSLIIRTLAQNYAKKCKNGTISKIEIVRVRKKIFYFSFQFLKAKQEYIMVNILVWTKRWPGAVKVDILEKSFSKCAKFTNDRIARLNRYIIRTNHPFHLKFCTVAPFFEFCTKYVMTSIIYSNLCEKFVKIQRDIIHDIIRNTTHVFAQRGMNSNISKV